MNEQQEWKIKKALAEFIRKNFVLTKNLDNPIIQSMVIEKTVELYDLFMDLTKK